MDIVIDRTCLILGILFFLCYAYQFGYMLLSVTKKIPPHKNEPKPNRFAVLICARNEAQVIAQLLDSIRNQTYPAERVTTFVMADNCTDNTAEIARQCGAIVFERHDTSHVGKGYALEALLQQVSASYPDAPFDGYFVFDADNVLDEHYIEEMNRTFSDGYRIVTSYRNTKNFSDNWISAGYGLWFLHEAKHLNNGRMLSSSSCAVSGTGFLFSQQILEKNGGWPFHLLTEDIEFTIQCVTSGERVGYCPDAMLFDEQPVTFRQSWKQRLRWAKGYIQVFRKYGKKMVGGIFHGSFSCYDMTMCNMPALVLSIVSVVVNLTVLIVAMLESEPLLPVVDAILNLVWYMYGIVFLVGAFTTITEWKKIYASTGRKIWSVFTFPLFMMTYLPISIAAFFERVSWEPIVHNRSRSLKEIRHTGD